MDIRGKVAIVTGGASGISAGIARRFVQEGARGVVVADLNLEQAQGVAKEIGRKGAQAGSLALRGATNHAGQLRGRIGALHRNVPHSMMSCPASVAIVR